MIPELAALVGTWRGAGVGHFPTIDDFAYSEELVIEATPRPVLATRQRTWIDGAPMHVEVGYLRWVGEGDVEWVLAQPTGLAEVASGTLRDAVLDVTATVHPTPTAVEVRAVRRLYRFSTDEVAIDLWMATAAVPSLTHHLSGVLVRD